MVLLRVVGHRRYARRDIHTNISHDKYNMYQNTVKRVYKYPEARLMLKILSPLNLLGLGARQGGAHTNISYYKYNMYHARIKRIYKYSEARLMMQSLSP